MNEPTANEIDETILELAGDKNTSTLSLLFPKVMNIAGLQNLIATLKQCKEITFEETTYQNYLCIGLRVKISDKLSWISGFGPFDFLPKTRQAPFVEIAYRIKDRPEYDCVMKESPKNTLHLANINMGDISKEHFEIYSNASLENTKKILE